MTRTTGQRVRSVTIPYVTLRSIGQGVEFIGWLVLARRLDPAGLGELTVAFLLCRYAGLVADWGAIGRGARDVSAEGRHGSIRAYLRLRTSIAVALSGLGLVLFAVTGHIALAPLVVVVPAIGMSRDWIGLGRERGVRAGVSQATQGLVFVGVSVLASTPAEGAIVVAVAYGLGLVVSIAVNRAPEDAEQTVAGRPDHWLLVALLASQLTSTLDVVLLGGLVSTSDAGIYAAVYRFPNAFIALLGGMIGVLLPFATRTHQEDKDEHQRFVGQSMRVSALAAVVVLASIPVFYYVAPALLGPAYDAGRTPLVLLIVATAVITLTAPLHPILVSRGRDRRYAAIACSGTVINLGLNLLLIPPFQMVGAAVATLAAQVVVSVVLVYFVLIRPT
jgi:O-antigen/teichoic acid export membrane protein